MNKYSDLQQRLSAQFFPPIHSPKPRQLIFSDSDEFLTPISYPLTTRISALTQNENLKVLNSKGFESSTPSFSNSSSKSTISHSSKDFSGLIKGLESVTNRQESTNFKMLFEGEISKIRLEQGGFHYYQIICKDKRSPLKVVIRRQKGKIRCFASKSMEKPNHFHHDQAFCMDTFEIPDLAIKFSYDFLYLSIEALVDTVLSIMISFGKARHIEIPPENHVIQRNKFNNDIEELRKSEDLRNQFKEKVDKLLKKRKNNALKLSGSKNFLKINKNVTGSISEKAFMHWGEKRVLVVKRKNENYLEKRTNAMKTLQKKERNWELEKLQKEEHEQCEKVARMQKDWIMLIFLIKTALNIRKTWVASRSTLILSLQYSNSARVIQKKFKKKYLNLGAKGLILLNCRNNLLLFHESSAKLLKSDSEAQIFSGISVSALNNALTASFLSFSTKVVFIQKAGKSFLLAKKRRIGEIQHMWEAAISKLTCRASSILIPKYLGITSRTRNGIINKYYSDQVSLYLNSIKPYQSRSNSRKLSLKVPSRPIEFTYLPSEQVLRELIELAASASYLA